MGAPRVVITDNSFVFTEESRKILLGAGVDLVDAEGLDDAGKIAAFREADALLVVWYPLTADILRQLPRCRVIVRSGIGVDNIDLDAARACGIPVCNVPDYCINEVADHAVSLALALARALPFLDRSVREGVWKPTLPARLPAFGQMTFATLGFGRIARAVLQRAAPFGFRLAAHDPYAPDDAFAAAGVEPLGLDDLVAQADVLSLHAPLAPETEHVINADRLARMKPNAVLVNTARGGLVDTVALAEALRRGTPAAAGLDVFETEPLPEDHPIRQCPNALLTPHFAWRSEQSLAQLPVLAAEELLRGLRGEPLRSQVN